MNQNNTESYAAIITVGTRDLQIDHSLLSSINTSGVPTRYENNKRPIPRVVGQLIKKNYTSLKKKIETPIITPFLSWLKHYEYADKVTRVILVATDQNERQRGERDNDTVEFAEVLKKMLSEQLVNLQQDAIDILRVKQNVADLDRQYEDFRKLFTKKPLSKIQDAKKVFILNQAGIGAINTSLMLHGLNYFGERVELISVNKKDKAARKQAFSGAFQRDRSTTIAKQLVGNHNYSGLKALQINPRVNLLAESIDSRLSFDFEAARISAAQLDDADMRDDIIEFFDEIEENEWEKIREVYRNAKVMLAKGQYVDFLIRIFRIVEGVSMFNVLKEINKSDFNIWKWNEWFDTYINAPENSKLKDYLLNEKIIWDRSPSTKFWVKTWGYYDKKDQPFFEKLQSLSSYRNNTIGAHGYKATSRKKVEEVLASKDLDLNAVINKLDNYFNLEEDSFSFEKMQGYLIRLIDSRI